MFPIRDHNPSRHTPYVTIALMAVNIVIFILYWPLFSQPSQLNSFFYDWALVPALATEGINSHGFLTSMFLHGGVMHLAGNMLFLWIFGDNLEDKMGHLPYLGFYVASGLAAAFAQYISEPTSQVPMVGASGAIAGVMGGYLLLFPKARVDVLIIFVIFFRIFPLPAWIMLGLWFALQTFGGLSAASGTGGVAYWAHAGGFLAGILLTLPLWLKGGGPAYWQRTDGHPPHPETRYTRSSIPTVRRRR